MSNIYYLKDYRNKKNYNKLQNHMEIANDTDNVEWLYSEYADHDWTTLSDAFEGYNFTGADYIEDD